MIFEKHLPRKLCILTPQGITSLILLGLLLSCSTQNSFNKHPRCGENSDCIVEDYENLLKVFGLVETDLVSGNSFSAVKRLEKIKQQAYYHGRFKSLHQLALKACINSTNALASRHESCGIVRERVLFLKRTSPDFIDELIPSVSSCKIDLSQSPSASLSDFGLKEIELSSAEASNNNLFNEAMKLRRLFNSDPWEKLLLIDLKVLASYKFKIGELKLSKEMPTGKIRFISGFDVEQNGSKTSYCDEYKAKLHDNSFSKTINCFDYPEFSDHLANIWRGSNGFHQWVNETYLTEIKITDEISKHLFEIPFTKDFKKNLSLRIKYDSEEVGNVVFNVEYPGDKIPQNLMARLAYINSINSIENSRNPSREILRGSSTDGVDFAIYVAGVWGYEIRLDIPDDIARSIEAVELYIPLESIRNHYYEVASQK